MHQLYDAEIAQALAWERRAQFRRAGASAHRDRSRWRARLRRPTHGNTTGDTQR